MPELHPLVVHFPIALFLLAPVLDLLGWVKRMEWGRPAATALTGVGAVAAVVAGTLAAPAPSPGMLKLRGATELFEIHQTLGTIVMIVGPLLVVTRLAVHKWAPTAKSAWVVLPVVGAAFAAVVGVTGHFGGTMVYEHGVGTKTVPAPLIDNDGNGNAAENTASNDNTETNNAADASNKGSTTTNNSNNASANNTGDASNNQPVANATNNDAPASDPNAPAGDPNAPAYGYDNPDPYMCPMTDEELFPDELFIVEHEGKRFALCCPTCVRVFKADPARFTAEWTR